MVGRAATILKGKEMIPQTNDARNSAHVPTNVVTLEFHTLLADLWRGGSFGHFWTKTTSGVAHTHWCSTDSPSFPDVLPNHNIYLGVHPVNQIPSTNRRGEPVAPEQVRSQLPHIAAVNCLFAEWDTNDTFPTKDAILAHLDTLPIYPSGLWDSGGGLQGVWVFNSSIPVDDTNREHLRQLQSDWVDYVRADPGAKDLARVLRVPGTVNWKAKYAPNYPTVTLLDYNRYRLYRLADFEQLIAEFRSKQQQTSTGEGEQPIPAAINLDDQELWDKMFASQNGERIRRLYDGNLSDHHNDHSAADQALCNDLAYWTGKDVARIDRMFRQSGLMRDKWDERKDYRDITINKAINATPRTYNPDYRSSNPAQGNPAGAAKKRSQFAHPFTGQMIDADPSTPLDGEATQSASDDRDGRDDGKKSGSGDKPKQADQLLLLAEQHGHFFIGRGDSQPYASVLVDGHRECYRLNSARFTGWLAQLFYDSYRTMCSAQAVTDVKHLLAFKAREFVEDVFLRVGHHEGKVYIDIGSPEGDAIEVDETGWRIVPIAPVNFRRTEAMLPLVLPTECKDPRILTKYLNIEPDDWPLLAAWVIAALHPRGPYPILAFLSRAGSGKSTQLRVLKRILDPSSAELRSQPGDVRDLFIAAANSWVLAFDNVSQLSPEVSDALCVIATGGGYTKRANYTDGEETVINVQRPILINGVGDIISRPDLMDRAIPIGTPYIAESKRRDETEFWEGFEQDKSQILGAFLHALSVGLANVSSTVLTNRPRMADFARLATAAEPAYSDGVNNFGKQYAANREDAADTIISNSPLGEVLLRVLGTSTSIKLEPEELFTRLNAEATEYDKKADGWPKHSNKLRGALQEIAVALDKLGIQTKRYKSNGIRWIEIWRTQ